MNVSGTAVSWVNGAVADRVAADDRGLLLGDGAFETLSLQSGRLLALASHAQRLHCGLARLGFPGPAALAREALRQAAEMAAGLADGSLRVTVTRGVGPRGYCPPPDPEPTILIRHAPTAAARLAPMTLGVADTRWAHQPQLAGLKLIARIEPVLAAQEARDRGCDDVVMRDPDGGVVSLGMGNLFLRRGTTLVTPPITGSGIAGTRRRALLEGVAAAAGFSTQVGPLTLADLDAADELIACNSLWGCRPVAALAGRGFADFSAATALDRALDQALDQALDTALDDALESPL